MQDAGIDLGDEELLARRSWPWLRTRVLGLLTTPLTPWAGGARIQRALIPMEPAAYPGLPLG